MNMIASYQPLFVGFPSQAWRLNVDLEKKSADLYMEDGDGKAVFHRIIRYTDFDIPTIELWVEDGALSPDSPTIRVILLPSEH